MAKVQNTFLKSKMNKDLDARILPEGEYRDARNAQISKSESAQVGNLENTLGNISVSDYFSLTLATDIVCIGAFPDELNSVVYLFFTDYKDKNPNRFVYEPTAKNFIISTNILSNESTILVKGAFLNFSQTNLITGVNVLEDLLFFTDNRNQPRVINTTLANPNPSDTNPIYYSTEDQISVAKYNPYEAIELYNKSLLSTDPVPYETTMKDVSSLFLPNGGSALSTASVGPINVFNVDNVQGEINIGAGSAYGAGGASKIFLQDNLSAGTNQLTDTGETVVAVVDIGGGVFEIEASGNITILNNQRVVFNANPYYDPTFAGDPDYLESKFARFSYRYKFVDNEYSIFAPFTQITFIPKQDGYFMFVDPNNVTNTGSQAKNDQDEAYRSTIVYFVENKVNQIDLRIPLPFTNYSLEDGLKIKSLDILYKESDGLAVRVVETIPIDVINNQSAVCLTDEPAFPGGASINIKDIQGGIQIGSVVTGVGIPDGTTVVGFTPTDPSNPVTGKLDISVALLAGELDDNILLEIGDTNYFTYSYESTKPTKTLPESNLIRVFDKIPVRAKAQEVAGNRVIYGNFQNKITPPEFLNYNVTSTAKSNFNINEAITSYVGVAATYAAGTPIVINVGKADGGFFPGMFVSSNTYGVNIPANTELTSTTNNATGPATITLSNDVTFPSGAINPVVLIFEPGANVQDSTSKIEYPNSSVKTNRNYQIGFVLSDRYGRQSSVILSSEKQNTIASFQNFGGSTLYSPYIDQTIDPTSWPGNALKVLVNSPIPNNNLYNGDITDKEYNPLGWYSYKIVVKQQEQEYYNVYLPGIMASYPDDITKEIGQTSHTVLINDNINKVPRDLTEVGPDQKQFRSSVQLIGRVQNIAPTAPFQIGETNSQYYPNRATDTVSVISTLGDLFDFNPADPPLLNLFPQFYSLESNPLVARLSTEFQIGQLANTNYTPVGATSIASAGASNTITLTATSGTTTPPVALNSLVNYLVVGAGIPAETYVDTNTALGVPVGGQFQADLKDASAASVFVDLPDGVQISFIPTDGPGAIPAFELTRPGIQYLAVAETEPVESALDIFWETSTSGLISDLNAAILNSQSQPAANNITWNPNFDESLAENGQILASAFSLVDSFGQTIPITATDIVEFGAPNDGPAVTNGNGDDVNGAGFVSTTNVRDYFRLVDLGSSPTGFGPYQIQTTSQTTPAALGGPVSASSNYYDNIYYFYNEEEALRQFNFTFRIVVDGQENFITKSANLANVSPEFFIIEAINNPGANQTYGPGGVNPMPALVPVDSNKGVLEIAKLQINNGASNITDPNANGGRALSTRDLKIVDQQFNDQGIWSQNFGSPNGPVAEIDGQPIFSILTDTNTNTGVLNYKIVNNFFVSTELVAAGIYYITLALQDGGGTLVFQQIEVDLRLSLGNDNFWNKSHEVDQYGIFAETYNGSPPQFILTPDGFGDYCGNNCQSASNRTNWWHFPSTLFEIKDTDPGSSQNDYGWYIYGLGFFDNTSEDAAICCDSENNHGVAGSLSMVEYSQLAGTGTTITIPMNTPITAGEHLVQKQTTDVVNMPITAQQIPQWGLPPLIHGRIAVTDYDPVNYLWTYEILEGDDATPVEGGAPGTALTGCMKIFVDVGGDVANPGAGWNYNNGPITQGQMQTRVIEGRPGRRVERIKYTTVNGAGDKQFYYKVQPDEPSNILDGRNRGGIAILDPNWNFLVDGPQIVYSYHGPFNYQTSPWFYRPTGGQTTSMQPILEVWAMYKYSGLMPSKWRKIDRFDWVRWNQQWDLGLYPPTPVNDDALEDGIYELMDNGDPGCISHTAQLGQIWRPDNADQFQFSVI